MNFVMQGSSGGGSVVVTYSVPATTTTLPSPSGGSAPSTAAATSAPNHSLAFTGAPLALEMTASFGLLVAGGLAALSTHRRTRRAVTGAQTSSE